MGRLHPFTLSPSTTARYGRRDRQVSPPATQTTPSSAHAVAAARAWVQLCASTQRMQCTQYIHVPEARFLFLRTFLEFFFFFLLLLLFFISCFRFFTSLIFFRKYQWFFTPAVQHTSSKMRSILCKIYSSARLFKAVFQKKESYTSAWQAKAWN